MRTRSLIPVALAALALPATSLAAGPKTERESLSSTGAQVMGYNALPAVSADGRWVAFDSYAPDVIAGDTNGTRDTFLRDRQTGETRRISQKPDGTQANGPSAGPVM